MQHTKDQLNMLIDQSDEVVGSVYNPIWICFKSILLLLLGTALAAIFADPLVDAVDKFSIATSIPSFFMSFIVMPLTTNSSEAVSSIFFASRKKQRTCSLTFSEVSVARYISILKGFLFFSFNLCFFFSQKSLLSLLASILCFW